MGGEDEEERVLPVPGSCLPEPYLPYSVMSLRGK